jgi:hypothetical protein
MLWQAADATGCRCSEIDLVNMWKSSVGGLGEHEMGVMRTKGRARFVTHLGDKDSVDEEFLAREFGNFLEERMGVRLEDGVGCGGCGDDIHTAGKTWDLLKKGLSAVQKMVAPTEDDKKKRAFLKAGKRQLEAEANEKVALSKLEGNINNVEKNRQAIEAAEKKKNKAFKKPDSEE